MIKKVETEHEYEDVLDIRKVVFVEEQGVSLEEEIDEFGNNRTIYDCL